MGDDLGTVQGAQREGFTIDGEPLFGQDGDPMDDATSMEDDGGDMDGTNFVTKKDPKNRGFMVKQDRYLLAKMQFCDAEKKPRTYWTYWWKVTKFFHEPWKFSPYNIL
jgi:hypothetical protein